MKIGEAVGIVVVDLCWTGGLTDGRKIAAMSETYHKPFAPHDCLGPGGFTAAVPMSFSRPNTLTQESARAFYSGWRQELVTGVPTNGDGFVQPMHGPGPVTEWLPAVYEISDLILRRSEA